MIRHLVAVLALMMCAGPILAVNESEPAVPVRTVQPQYPEELRRQGVEGMVVVAFTVDEKGNVVDPEVMKCTREEFQKPAVEAVRKWKFKPARENGAPVARRVSIPIHFAVEK